MRSFLRIFFTPFNVLLSRSRLLVSLTVSLLANALLFYLLLLQVSFSGLSNSSSGSSFLKQEKRALEARPYKKTLVQNQLPRRLSSQYLSDGSAHEGQPQSPRGSLQERLLGSLGQDKPKDKPEDRPEEKQQQRIEDPITDQVDDSFHSHYWSSLQKDQIQATALALAGEVLQARDPVAPPQRDTGLRSSISFCQVSGKMQEMGGSKEQALQKLDLFLQRQKKIIAWGKDLLHASDLEDSNKGSNRDFSQQLCADWTLCTDWTHWRAQATSAKLDLDPSSLDVLKKEYGFLHKEGFFARFVDLQKVEENLLAKERLFTASIKEQPQFFATQSFAGISLSPQLVDLFFSKEQADKTLYMIPWIYKSGQRYGKQNANQFRFAHLRQGLSAFSKQLDSSLASKESSDKTELNTKLNIDWSVKLLSESELQDMGALSSCLKEIQQSDDCACSVFIWCDTSQLKELLGSLWKVIQEKKMNADRMKPHLRYSVVLDLEVQPAMRAEPLKALLRELDFVLYQLGGHWSVATKNVDAAALVWSSLMPILQWGPEVGELEVHLENAKTNTAPLSYCLLPKKSIFDERLLFCPSRRRAEGKPLAGSVDFALFQNEHFDLLVTEKEELEKGKIDDLDRIYMQMEYALKEGKSPAAAVRLFRKLYSSRHG